MVGGVIIYSVVVCVNGGFRVVGGVVINTVMCVNGGFQVVRGVFLVILQLDTLSHAPPGKTRNWQFTQ